MNTIDAGTHVPTMAIPSSSPALVPPPIWGHFTAGVFLVLFGSCFVALALLRLRRLILSHSPIDDDIIAHAKSSDLEENVNRNESQQTDSRRVRPHMERTAQTKLLQSFLAHHAPELDPRVLQKVSLALFPTAVFGFLYQGLGVSVFDHILHPEYTFFHYTTHMTATLLALFAGWTGWLESRLGVLPRDSFRASLVFGFLAEALLWLDHASTKTSDVNARLHAFLALISILTALFMGTSMFLRGSSSHVLLAFASYVLGYVGLMWQGTWFMVVAYHLKWNFMSAEHVTVLFVCVAIGYLLLIQVGTAYMMLLWKRKVQPKEISSLEDEKEVLSPLVLSHPDNSSQR